MIKRLMLFLIPAGLVLGTFLVFYFPTLQVKLVRSTLASQGLSVASIGAIERRGSLLYIEEIILDADEYSVLKGIQFESNLSDILKGNKPKTVRVKEALLTGELTENWNLSIIGMDFSAKRLSDFTRLYLEYGRLDLLTRWGSIRLESKAKVEKNAEGKTNISGLVWGKQNQLRLQAKVDSFFDPDGTWITQIDLSEASLLLPELETSRVSGWVSYEAGKTFIPRISSQIFAGKLNLGDLALLESKLTLEGPLNDLQAIMEGDIVGTEDSVFSIDANNNKGGFDIQATLSGSSHEELLENLEKLQQTFRKKTFRSDVLTPLMLTPGNMTRLKDSLKDMSYDRAQIVLSGSLYDMTGKLITSRVVDGKVRRSVMSLDPSSL